MEWDGFLRIFREGRGNVKIGDEEILNFLGDEKKQNKVSYHFH